MDQCTATRCNGQSSLPDKGCNGHVTDLSQESIDLDICTSDVVPSRGLHSLYKSGRYTDITFYVEGHTFEAHRVVVASQSPFFDRLLYGDMMESGSCEIPLGDTPPEAFGIILEYMYSGKVGKVDLQTALELLGLSDKYDFPELKSHLEDSLKAITDFTNALQFYFYADLYSATKLHRHCANFIDNNAKIIINGNTILELPQDSLKHLISRDTFVVEELDVFHAIQRWMDYNHIERRDVHDLLWCVRLSEIPQKELLSTVQSSGLYDSLSIGHAVESQRAVEQQNVTTRGKAAVGNLFEVNTTELCESWNFHHEVHPDKVIGEFCPPCYYTFILMVRASEAPYSAVLLEFNDLYLINELQLHAESGGERCEVKEPFSYYVEVSKDGERWVCVVNHGRVKCYSLQKLHFPKQAARFLRYVQTRGYEGCAIKFVSCSNVTPDPPFHFEDTIMVPCCFMTPALAQHVTFIPNKGLRFFLTFHQPYCISVIKIGFSGHEGLGNLDVAISVVNKARHYQTVAILARHDFRHELVCSFSRQPVCIVSITVTALFDDEGTPLLDQETGQFGLSEEKTSQMRIRGFYVSSTC